MRALGHIAAGGSSIGVVLLVAAGVAGLLVLENHIVAGRPLRLCAKRRTVLAVLAVTALSAALLPVGQAQPATGLLPDLISDPPKPALFNELNTPDGQTRLVLTFDGYVHNIGEGALDVVGNPQQTKGMRQRVRNGDTWEDVGTPTVRFETDDGHNHFHLIEAIEYVLWNEFQGAQTAIGSKIGFCLVDSEQMEPGGEQAYSEELDNFCQENNPTATSLRMGISSGWRDIYDATTTLQWVDVSDVAPGRYWIGAITDPNDEIRESNEDNNALIFSERTVSVPGFAPRPQQVLAVDGASIDFQLESTAHGNVTEPVYVIEKGPRSGVLDVPTGADLGTSAVRYTPEPGFEGLDQIVFSVHDAASPYPFVPPTQTIDFDVRASAAVALDDSDEPRTNDEDRDSGPALVAPSTFFETTVGEQSLVEIEVGEVDGEPGRLFARGLPAGLVADAESGSIRGVAVDEGIFEVELVAMGSSADQMTSQSVTWIVNPLEADAGLRSLLDLSSPRGVLTSVRVGVPALGQTYEASGLPPGVSMQTTTPVLSGTPTEVGNYVVTVSQLAGGGLVDATTFTWTIRATTDIDFVL